MKASRGLYLKMKNTREITLKPINEQQKKKIVAIRLKKQRKWVGLFNNASGLNW